MIVFVLQLMLVSTSAEPAGFFKTCYRSLMSLRLRSGPTTSDHWRSYRIAHLGRQIARDVSEDHLRSLHRIDLDQAEIPSLPRALHRARLMQKNLENLLTELKVYRPLRVPFLENQLHQIQGHQLGFQALRIRLAHIDRLMHTEPIRTERVMAQLLVVSEITHPQLALHAADRLSEFVEGIHWSKTPRKLMRTFFETILKLSEVYSRHTSTRQFDTKESFEDYDRKVSKVISVLSLPTSSEGEIIRGLQTVSASLLDSPDLTIEHWISRWQLLSEWQKMRSFLSSESADLVNELMIAGTELESVAHASRELRARIKQADLNRFSRILEQIPHGAWLSYGLFFFSTLNEAIDLHDKPDGRLWFRRDLLRFATKRAERDMMFHDCPLSFE